MTLAEKTEPAPSTRLVDAAEYTQHIKNLDIYGYTLVSNFVNLSLVQDLKDCVNRLWMITEKEKFSGRPERDVGDKLVYNLQNKDKKFIDILGESFVRRVCMTKLNDPYYGFLPKNKPNYILSYYNARTSGGTLDLHIDSRVPNPGPWCTSIQIVYLLDGMDESNGCTVVVPGSHRSGDFTDRGLNRRCPVVANAGDLVIWDSRLWHGTTENVRNASRWALVATLTQWWMKQSMDMTRSLPEPIYSRLNDEQKALLGFCSIPPADEYERINTKTGYDLLKPSVADYYPKR